MRHPGNIVSGYGDRTGALRAKVGATCSPYSRFVRASDLVKQTIATHQAIRVAGQSAQQSTLVSGELNRPSIADRKQTRSVKD